MALERLQKVLAQAGVASRRKSEVIITDGRVRVNGKIVTELGTKVDPRKDKVELDGKRLIAEHRVYYLLHKPREVVSTVSDPQGRKTVCDVLGRVPQRVFPVGRLDYHTSGALLLSNDGAFCESLLKPHVRVPKVYRVKMKGHLSIETLNTLRNGVTLDDGYKTREAELFVLREEANFTVLQITLLEGKNRQIHRMGDAVGHRVMRLARLSFAGINVDDLRPGEYRELGKKELQKLEKTWVTPYKQRRRNAAQSLNA